MSSPTSEPTSSPQQTAPATSSSVNAASATAEGQATPDFGWTQYAERINGRFAMVGFVALLLLELWTGEGFFHWLGF